MPLLPRRILSLWLAFGHCPSKAYQGAKLFLWPTWEIKHSSAKASKNTPAWTILVPTHTLVLGLSSLSYLSDWPFLSLQEGGTGPQFFTRFCIHTLCLGSLQCLLQKTLCTFQSRDIEFDEWDISRPDTSKDLRSACAVGLSSFFAFYFSPVEIVSPG